ncbi:rhamnogalacturonan acetylesterase [Saccharicrinis sp. FJH62]|uniref:rhamnogalacturonan acetylesterase n=1 Tax=Saccharicrinis sp. FJH62 TaxID=3344657 RepID=UPI0035D419BB
MKKLLTGILLAGVVTIGFLAAHAQTKTDTAFPEKFDFGSEKTPAGYIAVTPKTVYSKENGLGIASNFTVHAIKRDKKNNLTSDFLTSEHPFYFNVNIPEGRYRITVTLGDPKGTSETTVKAENRRLMLEDIKTDKKQIVTKSFIVDVRSPKINDEEKIRLKKRELAYLNWDKKLTLEFGGPRPCVSSLEIEAVNDLPVIFLAGNSTVVDQMYEPWASWGQMFPRFLKPDVVVANYAESGETLKAFRGEKRLKKILSVMKPGDYLFMEFAHNDQKPGSSHVEPFTTYQDQLRYFMNETRKRGGHPVLVTSTNRRVFDDNGKIVNTLEEYPEAMRQLAKEENVPLIDLNAMSKELFEALGPENSKKAFVHYPAHTYPGQDKPLADNTHFNPYGAYELAKCVVESIKENYPQLAKYVSDDFKGYDPNHPDSYENFFWPVSPAVELIKPDGN